MRESGTEPIASSAVSIASSSRQSSRLRKPRHGSTSTTSSKVMKIRPETTISLNKPSFRADEPITGFIDIDTKAEGFEKWDSKVWCVKLRLVGYAQMDTQWEDRARNPDHQDKLRFETLPIEDVETTVNSNATPLSLRAGVPNHVRSLKFQIKLSPSQLISSYNAKKGLFLVDYLLTATTRKKCPSTGWSLMKLESRTFVNITPPQAEIEKPLQVTPYSPPLSEMDLFRCPFMQTIRFNYSHSLTPSTLSPSHRMSIYFPKPLYEPEDISISLASTLTLRYNEFVNRNTEVKEIDYEASYYPDSGGEEVSVQYDVPVQTPQSMDFTFSRGSMSMTHSLRISMKVRLFPEDKSKSSIKMWSIDLPVKVKGQHYIASPLSPASSTGSPTQNRAGDGSTEPSSLSHKTSDASHGSWFRDRARLSSDSTDGTVPLSAVSATSSFATTTGASDITEEASVASGSPRRSVMSPTISSGPLRVVNRDSIPPQKPAPKGPIPKAPESKTPSPVTRHRQSPESTRSTGTDKSNRKQLVERQPESPLCGREKDRPLVRSRSRSVPSPSSFKPEISMHDPFLPPLPRDGIRSPEPYNEPQSATSISTKSTMPPTPTTSYDVPLYYQSKPTYLIDINPPPKAPNRPRAKTAGAAQEPLSPRSPTSSDRTPTGSPPTTKVKFNPKVDRSPSPPPLSPRGPSSFRVKSPSPQSPQMNSFPFRAISPPPRKDSGTPASVRSVPPATMQSRIPMSPRSSPSSVKSSTLLPSRIPLSPTSSTPAKFSPTTSQSPTSLPSSVLTSSSKAPINPSPPATYSTSALPRAKPTKISIPTSPISPRTITPKSISSQSSSQHRTAIPVSTRKISPPPMKTGPTPRPPLPSQDKERITSFATEATTSTQISQALTASTKATSVSETASTAPRVQLKRRPTNPSLFPPLPPATLAVQRLQYNGDEPKGSADLVGKDRKAAHMLTVGKDGRLWI